MLDFTRKQRCFLVKSPSHCPQHGQWDSPLSFHLYSFRFHLLAPHVAIVWRPLRRPMDSHFSSSSNSRLERHWLEQRSQLVRPVPCVAGCHLLEAGHQIVGEGELLRIERSTRDGNRFRRQPGKLRQHFIELLLHLLKFLLLCMKWTERENGHGPGRQGGAMPCQEMKRVFVPAEHVERRAQHHRTVLIEGLHLAHGCKISRNPAFAQRCRYGLGNFLRRSVACRISDKNRS